MLISWLHTMCNYLLSCSYQLLECSDAFHEESDYEVLFQNCSNVIYRSVCDLLLAKMMKFYCSPLHKINKFVSNQLKLLNYEHQKKHRLKLLHAQNRDTPAKLDHLILLGIQSIIKQSSKRKYIFINYFNFLTQSCYVRSSLFLQQW